MNPARRPQDALRRRQNGVKQDYYVQEIVTYSCGRVHLAF